MLVAGHARWHDGWRGRDGERHVWLPGRLDAAAQFVEAELTACGYAVARQGVEAEGRTVYNLEADPPTVDGVCDKDGGALMQRDDDQPEPIRRRLALYAEQTAPLLTYYGAQGLVETVDGDQPIATVTADIEATVEKRTQTKVSR